MLTSHPHHSPGLLKSRVPLSCCWEPPREVVLFQPLPSPLPPQSLFLLLLHDPISCCDSGQKQKREGTGDHRGESSFQVTGPCVCCQNLLPSYSNLCVKEVKRGQGTLSYVVEFAKILQSVSLGNFPEWQVLLHTQEETPVSAHGLRHCFIHSHASVLCDLQFLLF